MNSTIDRQQVSGSRVPIDGILAVLLTIILGFLYYDVLAGLLYDWDNDPDYSHGFLVPFISAYFVWERLKKLKTLTVNPNGWGIPFLGIGALMLVVGSVGAELFTQRLSLIVVLGSLVLLILGRDFLRCFSLPIAFLVFMIPLPAIVVNTIAFPLQLFAAQTAAFCLFNLGIPVLREGNLIYLATATLEVAEACSGLRSLMALLALGSVYGYFSQSITWKRWALVVISIPIAILANVFRVTGTGVLANYWGPEAAEGFYHTFEGWLVFVVAFVLLLACGTLISRINRPLGA